MVIPRHQTFSILEICKLLTKENSPCSQLAMLSPKRLAEKAKKRFPLMRSSSRSSSCSDDRTTALARKGHFIVYTMDDTRFMVPLVALDSCIFQQLLKISEEEFGLPRDGPITLACSAMFMEYVLSLLQRHIPEDVERALLASINANPCSTSFLTHLGTSQQQLVALI